MAFDISKWNLTIEQIDHELDRLEQMRRNHIDYMKEIGQQKYGPIPFQERTAKLADEQRFVNDINMKIEVYKKERAKRMKETYGW